MTMDEIVVDEHRRRRFTGPLTALSIVKLLAHCADLVEANRMRVRERAIPQKPFTVVVIRDADTDQIALLRREGYLLIADHSVQCLRLENGYAWRSMEGGTSVWFRPLMSE